MRVEIPRKLDFLFRPARYKVAHGGRGCLAPGSKVIMADGSLRNIEDVSVGDLLMGPDSKPRVVLQLFRGREQMYRVKQTSAQEYVVNGAHILVLRKSEACKLDRGEQFASGNFRRPNGRYPDFPDEVEISVEDWLKQSKRWQEHFRGFRAGLIEFERKDVEVDPYLLGLWLGDGLHRELMITSADQEIRDWLKGFAERSGLRYTESKKYGASNKAVDVRLGRKPAVHGRKNPVWQGFKAYGVVSNKHIPEDYIVNDEATRLKLLAGLIDSDGHYARGGYEITLANERLARDTKKLADTLGFRTSLRERKTKCGDVIGRAWRVSINGATDRVPCILPRKQASISPNKDKMLSQISIEPVGEGDYYGVLLDGDHRFLLEDGTVTHNSGKSWSFAQALLILGAKEKMRILCTREVQKSIKDSVHKLLSDQIKRLGLESFYQVLNTEIRGKNGTEILFSGLSDQTADSIKSFEGVDVTWVEEAQTVTKRSWDILRPTIRKAGSEIWVTYNPELETDATHVMFVVKPPSDAVVVEVNWQDNPWFSAELEAERLDCLKNQPKDYDNIWEGKTKPAVAGAIYYDEITAMEKEGRIRTVPRNPTLPVHRIWDLGFNDLMAVILVQRIVSELAIVGYVTGSRRTLADYIAEFKSDDRYRNWNWGIDYLPHDGFTQRHQTGKSDADVLRGLGCKVEQTPSMTVEQGIRAARTIFPRVYIDKDATASSNEDFPGLVECLKRYRRHINKQTQTAGAPLHDQHSNGADAFRYLALNADRLPSTLDVHSDFVDARFNGRAPASRVGY